MSEQKRGGHSGATYRLEPSPENRFIPRAVEEIIKDQIPKTLATMKEYKDEVAKEKAVSLCSEIKDRVKCIV